MNKAQNFDGDRHWYAIYTRPRFEKKIDAELKRKNLHSFLPLHCVTRVWSDRIKKIQEPLFPSYLFVHANSRERYSALQSTGVVRVVSFNGQPVRIPDDQIEGIYKIIKFGYNPEPYQYLNYGDEVEIVSGPLRGLRGYYIEERGHDTLAVSVHAIQQSLTIQLGRGLIRKVARGTRESPLV
ncbi:MAG: UpxY family transcription antiterminator [bacterium]